MKTNICLIYVVCCKLNIGSTKTQNTLAGAHGGRTFRRGDLLVTEIVFKKEFSLLSGGAKQRVPNP